MKWEYKVCRDYYCHLDANLEKFGAEGWELVMCYGQNDVLIFKRPVPSDVSGKGERNERS